MCNWSVGSRCNRTISPEVRFFCNKTWFCNKTVLLESLRFWADLDWKRFEILRKADFPVVNQLFIDHHLKKKIAPAAHWLHFSCLKSPNPPKRRCFFFGTICGTWKKLRLLSDSVGEKLWVRTIIPENHWVGVLYVLVSGNNKIWNTVLPTCLRALRGVHMRKKEPVQAARTRCGFTGRSEEREEAGEEARSELN